MHVVEIGKTARRPAAADGDHHGAGELREARALQGDLAPARRWPKGLTDDAGARARQGRQVGRLDRRRPARDAKSSARSSCSRWSIRWSRGTDEETMRFLNDVIILCAAGEPGRHGPGVRRVHEDTAPRRHAGALQPLRRPRRQPRLLHERAAGDHEHEPHHVSRVVPADHVQPSPDRPGRRGDVRAAVPRSVQLQLPSDDPGRRSTSIGAVMHDALHRGRQAGRRRRARASSYSTWWNGGLRTTAYFHNQIGILTETIGNPTPQAIPFMPRSADRRLEHLVADRAAAGVALPPVDRLLDHGQPRDARLRVALSRERSSIDIYQMGKDEIKWGSEDHWTFTPHKMARVRTKWRRRAARPAAGQSAAAAAASASAAGGRGRRRRRRRRTAAAAPRSGSTRR